MLLSIVMPVYNEEQFLTTIIKMVQRVDLGDLERGIDRGGRLLPG